MTGPGPHKKEWRNRIVDTGMADPAELQAHPRNWRRHPQEQRDAMEGVLDSVGWIQDVIVNRRTGRIVDGHLRAQVLAGMPNRSLWEIFLLLAEP